MNPHPDNLQILGTAEHNAVSAKQAWFLKQLDVRERAQWEEFFASENLRPQTSAQMLSDAADERALEMFEQVAAVAVEPSLPIDDETSFP